MDAVKQVIVVRKDLAMPAGKLAAQVAHASMAFLTRQLRVPSSDPWGYAAWNDVQAASVPVTRSVEVDAELAAWIDGAFTKVVVAVPDEKTLLAVYESAKLYDCRRSLITDEGRTVFNGVPTNTCVAVGPNYISRVDAVTKYLPLYR